MSFSIFFVIFIKVATGMSEHDNYGVEFLKATTRIKALCKGPTFWFKTYKFLKIFPKLKIAFETYKKAEQLNICYLNDT